jgi:Ca-activated chloride channel family protein
MSRLAAPAFAGAGRASRTLAAAVVVVLSLPLAAPAAAASDDDGPGFLLPDGARLPLLSQETAVDVVGPVARVRITQRWRNDGRKALEATYLLPASTRAAVHDLTLSVGDRTVRADLQEKAKAQQTFADARAAGHTAGLLHQQRDNVLQLALTNLQPSEEVVVRLEQSLVLDREDGVWELALPQTIGPRYRSALPGHAIAAPRAPGGALPSTSIDVRISAPLDVHALGSPTHAVTTAFDGPRFARARIRSSAHDPVADRDFVLRFSLAGDEIGGGVLAWQPGLSDAGADDGAADDEGTFLLMVEPPAIMTATEAAPREVIFVLDVSGSMRGDPLQTASNLLHDLVGELRPRDRFNVLFFSGGSWMLAPTSVPATPENLDEARRSIAMVPPGGGTELIPALRMALATPRPTDDDGAFARSFVVLTDGFVSVEREAARFVREHIGDATLFAFGIGSSVNRELIERLARAGHTTPVVLTDPSETPRALARFVEAARPALTDLVMDTDGAPAFEPRALEPAGEADPAAVRLPDVYAGRPLSILGRFQGAPTGRLVLRGRTAAGRWEQTIHLDDADVRPDNAVLTKLWARRRVATIEDHDTGPAADAAVLALGLRHRLLTSQTSFVVVDSAARGAVATDAVVQPALAPAGTVYAQGHGSLGLGSASLGTVGAGGRGAGAAALGFDSNIGLRGGGPGLGLRGVGAGGGGAGGGGAGGGDRKGIGGLGGAGARVDVTATQGVPQVLGALDPEVVRRIVRAHAGQIRSCFETALSSSPGLRGKVVMNWVVGSDGRVRQVQVGQSQLQSDAVERCLATTIRSWSFPKPRGGGLVVVEYPFTFVPRG